MMNEINDWSWWQQALENRREIGKPHLPVSVDSPQQGFYKTRWPGKPWEPVAIWLDGAKWMALRSGELVDAAAVWNHCCRYPISAEVYEKAVANQGWEDDDPTVAAAMAGIGHNVGDTSESEQIADEIENAKQGADAYAKITSDDQANKAQSLRARVNELAGKADKQREALKKPHLDAGRAIDAEWMPLVKEAKAVGEMLRKSIEAFKTAVLQERRRLEAERQRAEQERLAEEARAREEAQAALAAGQPVVVPPEPAPIPPPLPPITDDKIKGTYGRAASIAVELVVTAITDQDALYQFLREYPDLRECLRDLAQRAVKAGGNPPGVTIEERAKIS